MKRTINSHSRRDSRSSLNSFDIDEDTEDFQSPQRRRMLGPDSLNILASYSPDIQNLCQSSRLSVPFHCHRGLSGSGSLNQSSHNNLKDTASPFVHPLFRVSLTPATNSAPPGRRPLADLNDVTLSLRSLQIQCSTPPSAALLGKENIPPPPTKRPVWAEPKGKRKYHRRSNATTVSRSRHAGPSS